MGQARTRIVFGLLVAVLGAALFVTASAYAVDHGVAKWLAAAVGGFAFPVAPALWQFVSERRRRARIAAAKTPPKTSLTGYDRFWMRFVVVALVVLGPMFAHSRFGVFGSVWRQALWFVPATPVDLSSLGTGAQRDFKGAEHLLKRVPGDAELVVVVHPPADSGQPAGDAVLAWGAKQAVIAVDEAIADKDKDLEKGIDELNAERDKVPWLPIDKLDKISTSDKTVLIASEGWKSKVEPAGTGPSEELLGELRRAPQDAVFVAAFAPRTKITVKDVDPETIRHGVLWASGDQKHIVLAGRLEAVDAAAATKLVEEIEAVLHAKTADIPAACRDEVSKLVSGLELQHSGAIVTARLELEPEKLFGLMFCATK
jgi:hypothetical protein